MKLKNSELNAFITHITPFSLSLTEGRMRNKLKKLLIDKFNEFEVHRQEIVNRFAKRDENGIIKKTILADNKESIEIENIDALNEEFSILSNEYVFIEENQTNEQMLRSIKNTILTDSNKYAGVESDYWELACCTVEEINYPETQLQVED